MNQIYLDTARLLTQIAPFVFVDGTFALKGGTAINLFLRDMPRLSVDLDLVFPDYRLPRTEAVSAIADALRQSTERLTARGFQVRPVPSASGEEKKLIVNRGKIAVKIEVNFVTRGTVHPVRLASLTPRARATLLTDLEIPVASLEDVYGGKLVAAMDRQHPRDLFDVIQLLANEGITPEIRRAFVAYLASHNRPVHEVLFPVLRNIRQDYERTFQGMTTEPVALETLLDTREVLVRKLQTELDANERTFLISLVNAAPEWNLLGIEHLAELPAIRWKLQNLEQLRNRNPKKHAEQSEALQKLL
jgi:predicted nucleotidyltransferase component of viral defense system